MKRFSDAQGLVNSGSLSSMREKDAQSLGASATMRCTPRRKNTATSMEKKRRETSMALTHLSGALKMRAGRRESA